jgi:hypothetical protein
MSGGCGERQGAAVVAENMTDSTRILHRLDGTVRNDPVAADVALLPTERALPIRRFFSWPGKRNYDGSWWSSTVRAHVLFESLLEREYLLAADFDTRVVGIAAQPVALLWPRSTSGQSTSTKSFDHFTFGGVHESDQLLPAIKQAVTVFSNAGVCCCRLRWPHREVAGHS